MIIKILNLFNSIISLLEFLFLDNLKFLLKIKSRKNKIFSIIFSYNRPLQLDGLLQSLVNKLDSNIKLYVLYKANKSRMDLSYKKLINSFRDRNQIIFIKEEKSFKYSINKLLNTIDTKAKVNNQILFFVDDQLVYKPINLGKINKLLKNSFLTTFRFGSNTKYSFNLNKKQNIKNYNYKFENNIFQWSPTFKRDDLSYLFSFDASTIPYDLFKLFAKKLIYKGPNSLESAMNYNNYLYKLLNLKISSLESQSAVNLVISIAQKETINRGNFKDLDYLLNIYENDWRLKLDANIISRINGPHIDFGGILIRKGEIRNV